uniref:Uncharacterized protein n=1 Tax=uncultured prokaryote TaxID=198431 RepID=A0A0H5QPU9_9ZZZZ|nr:hypothetical protein [uncultured prokaryote]
METRRIVTRSITLRRWPEGYAVTMRLTLDAGANRFIEEHCLGLTRGEAIDVMEAMADCAPWPGEEVAGDGRDWILQPSLW